MSLLFAVVSVGVVAAVLGVVGWVFLVAPYVVPGRHPQQPRRW